MTVAPDSALVLFPGALGDCLCFLPALAVVREAHRGRLCLVAQPAFLDLVSLTDTTLVSMQRREIADLFALGARIAPETAALFGGFSHIYSWTGFGNADFAQRLADVSGGDVHVHRFHGMRPGEHATDYYARCVGVAPAPLDASMGPAARTPEASGGRASVSSMDRSPLRGASGQALRPCSVQDCSLGSAKSDRLLVADAPQWFAEWAARHGLTARGFILLHPGSGGREKNWEGFDTVARHWRQHHDDAIVVALGPAEAERPTAPIADAIAVDGLSLTQVAALLRRCRLYLGNDSGISHLAGVVGATGVVVFGPTDPVVWGPRSECLAILYAPDSCVQCGAPRFCTHRLAVDKVFAALDRLSHHGGGETRRVPKS